MNRRKCWIKVWVLLKKQNAKVCWNRNKWEAHCTLSLEESNHQVINKLHSIWNTCFNQKNVQVSMEGKYKWLSFEGRGNKMFCEFCREFPKRENLQYSWGSDQIISKQTAWKHIHVSWGQQRTCFDQRSRKWNFFLTQHITCILYIQNFCFLSSHSCVHCKERMVCPLETHTCTWIITHVKSFLNIIISHTFKLDLVDFYLLWLMEQQVSHV